MRHQEPVPVTVLTGFLGAGKTTLLNHLLSQKHGYNCAVIINEFGPVSIDHRLVIGTDEEITQLNNGCLCCRVRGDLIRSLNELFRKQKRFDYVVIETTGLADPSPLAHTFLASELADKLRLDGIVTVVDARHLEKELNDTPEASAQIAFADVILINKTDLVTVDQLRQVEARVRSINILARIHHTHMAQINVGNLFNIHARDLTAPLNVAPEVVAKEDHHTHDNSDDDHTHHHAGESGQAPDHVHDEHHHDESVRSIYLHEERPLNLPALEAWLSEVVRTMGEKIYRAKGILHLKGQPKRVVFQGVQMLFDAKPDRLWHPTENRVSQLVFIGKDLDEVALRTGFEKTLA